MDAAAPNLRPNPAQEAFDKNEAQYALYRARKLAEREASEHPGRTASPSLAGNTPECHAAASWRRARTLSR